MAYTLLSNLVNPQLLADYVDAKLTDKMVFAPLCDIEELGERDGGVIYVPTYSYIGAATALGEVSALTPAVLSASTASVAITKIAKGVEISDEAALNAYGDPIGEAANQLVVSIADGLDSALVTILHGISGTMLYETSSTATDPKDTDITAALELFGEDVDGVKVAVVSPAVYTSMRSNVNSWIPASEVAAEIAVRGIVGEYQGCQVIVSDRVKTNKDIYIVKPGALRIFLRRDTVVEADRDITRFTTVLTASKHFAAYLYNSAKAIRIATKSA